MVVSAATSVTAPRGQPLDMNLSRQTSGNQPSVVGSASSGKQMQCRVDFLDDQHFVFRLPPKTLGQTLFDQVCEHLGLLETDYFGLEYGDTDGNKYWLDLEKPIGRQLAYKAPSANVLHVHFGVKFYTPDPVQLEEEITRYLFVLQIRKDLASGLMPCQDSTAALLAAYVVQAEEGDYSADNYRDYTYLLKYKFLPQQDVTFLSEVRNSHLQLVGQSPAEADLNFLETARRCEMYGIKLHAANDHENVALNLAVAHMGIVVFQNTQKINIFSWAKIRKLSFKRKRFLIKLHSEPGYGFYKDTVEFFFDSRNACKNFWKKCIEHHGFFRCPVVQTLPRSKTKIFPAGSSFRFSGRTQKQVLEFARDNYGKRPSFHRGTGSSRIRSSQSCGASLAATPLLPMARARDSRYNTTGGTRSRRSQQGENGALARSRSEPMEVTEQVMNPDRSSDSGSRTLERGHRVDASQEMPLSSNEHVPGDYQQQTSIMRTERYEEYRTAGANGHHVQEVVSVTVEDFIKKTPIHNSNLNSPSDENRPPSLTTADHSPRPPNSNHHQFYSLSSRGGGSASIPRNAGRSSGAAVITTSGTTGRLTGKNVSNTGGSGAYNVSTQLEELTKKINGWKQQSQESFIKSFESKSLAGCESMRTLAEDSMDGRKRRNPADVAYFVAKEILNGERTYKTDLEVICVQLKRELDEAEEIPQGLFQNVFSLLQPIYESQGTLLVEIEHRLSTWESRTTNTHRPDDSQRIGDLLLKQNDALEQYQNYLIRLPEILAEFDIAFRKNKAFEQFYRGFEQYRYCYLPLTAFLLKPAQRLFQYQSSLERLLTHYPAHHSDTVNCESALQNFRRTFSTVHDAVSVAEHFTKLVDLQRDLLGIDNLAVPTREFIREGCLLKLSKKGYQLRMFVLLTDVLLYTNRVSNTTGQFKLHGQIGVRGMMVEDAEPREGMEHCFTLYGGNRALMLAANTAEEKTRWLHDLHTAVDQSKRLAYDKLLQFGSLKSYSSSDEVLDKFDAFHVSPAHTATSDADTLRTKSPSERSVVLPRSNTTLHVCWHRQTTISIRELSRAFQLQQSGYLLRKFKNSTGWQKLWVVFTDFCLFFFKNNQEDCPLASLPLIGYRVTVPSLDDAIEKDHVIKLYFTTHKYFLRTDSEFSFHRWMEVLGLATQPDHQNISPDLNGTGMHV